MPSRSGLALRQFTLRLPGRLQQTVRVSHNRGQQPRPCLLVGPVDGRLSLDAGPQVPPVPLGLGPIPHTGLLHGRQGSHEFDGPVRQQIEGVFHSTASENIRGVQRHPHPALSQVARLPSQAQAGLEHRPHLVVENQLGPKHLECALGEGTVLNLDTQGPFPADVEVGPGLGLSIAHLVVGLEQQRRGSRRGGTLSRPLSAQ